MSVQYDHKILAFLLEEWCQPITHQTSSATEAEHGMDARLAKALDL